MKELQNLMSIGDVAKSFGVCVATVRRWCKNGKFSRVIRTIGNQRRFDWIFLIISAGFSQSSVTMGVSQILCLP